jgi:tripartite-type tricarboxylate transporter receptor subunit TctC
MTTRRVVLLFAAATVSVFAAEGAVAQSYPNRPIKIVVPGPPGGPHEIAVRTLAQGMSARLGQPVIVENLPGGAGGTIGVRSVVRAVPDGYSLLASLPGALVAAPAIYKDIGYDAAADLAPVATIFSSPQMLVVHPQVDAGSLGDLVAYAKSNPGKINYPSPGYGTGPHLLGEMLKQLTGIDIVHIPYKGVAGMPDLLAGRLQIGFETVPVLLPHVRAGKLRPLAVAHTARSPQLPDVPTTGEAGLPALQATTWMGVLAPAGTPAAVINTLNETINEIIQSSVMQDSFAKFGATPRIGSPQDFRRFLTEERRRWTQVITAAGIKVD